MKWSNVLNTASTCQRDHSENKIKFIYENVFWKHMIGAAGVNPLHSDLYVEQWYLR